MSRELEKMRKRTNEKLAKCKQAVRENGQSLDKKLEKLQKSYK